MRSFLVAVCGCALAVGCDGTKSPRGEVSGEVTFDDKPLPDGTIRFLPATPGPSTFARITDGKFHLAAENGPALGENAVEITATRKTGKMEPVPDSPTKAVREAEDQYIPAEYNINTTLKVTVEENTKPVKFSLSSSGKK